MSPITELSSPLNFGYSGLFGGVSSGGDNTNKESRKRAMRRTYCWTIQYNEVVITCRRECCFSTAGRSMISSPEWIKTVVSVIDSKMAWMMSPTSYLSAWLNFGRFGLVGGVLGAGTTQTRRVRRGLRAGRIVGRFNTTRLSLRVALSVVFQCRTMDNLLSQEDENGRLCGRFKDGTDHVAYHGVEPVVWFWSLWSHWRGFVRRGRHKQGEPEEGYAPVVLLVDSIRRGCHCVSP